RIRIVLTYPLLLTLHRPTRERDVAANSGTERLTRALSLDARSVPASISPARPSHCSTTQAESHLPPSRSRHQSLPQCETATARMTPNRESQRKNNSPGPNHATGDSQI